MTNRITEKQLNDLLNRINIAAGFDNPAYGTIGSYALDRAYGCTKLVKIVTAGGGQRDVTGYGTKRECFNQMQAFLAGMKG